LCHQPTQDSEDTRWNSKSLKPHSSDEEYIEDDSTNSETCSEFNQEDDDKSPTSCKHDIHELLSESEDSQDEELTQEDETEQREQLKAVTRHISRSSIQNYIKRRQCLLDVVVEKKAIEDDSHVIDEEDRDHSQVLAKQMMNISHGQISNRASFLYRFGINRYCKAANTAMCLKQKANQLQY